MTEWGLRIAQRRRELHMSVAELARHCGLRAPSVHDWEKGRTKKIEGDNLLAVATALQTTPEWILSGRGPASAARPTPGPIRAYDVEAIEDGDPVPDGWTEIEHIDFALSAGDGSAVPTFVETKYPLYYRMDWFHRHGAKPANVKSMSVTGDSMQATLYDRDRVAVHIADRLVVSNAVYALLLDGEACVKRLFRHGHGLRIVSDNQDKARYPDIIIEPDELADRVSIIGRVIDKSGAGGL